MKKLSIKLNFHIFPVLLVLGVGAVTVKTITSIGFDPNRACVGNARLLTSAISQYVQDYDEDLPLMQTPGIFRSELFPYVENGNAFICPDTGQQYKPNSAIGDYSIASFSEPYTVEVFMDSVPHTDGEYTVGFLDGHVEHGGVVQGNPYDIAYQRASMLSEAFNEYLQDYDETFPILTTNAQYENELNAYIGSPYAFSNPVNNAFFAPNTALSGVQYRRVNSPYTTPIFSDGSTITGYADWSVSQVGRPSAQTSASNLQQLGFALYDYVDDYDGYFPPMATYSQFENSILPYVGNNSSLFLSPSTGKPFLINSSLSGVSLASLQSPSTTRVAYDAEVDNNGGINTLYADIEFYNVGVQYHFVPSSLIAGIDGKVALVWKSVSGGVIVQDINGIGASERQNTYNLSRPGDGPLNNPPSLICPIEGDKRQILWEGDFGVFPKMVDSLTPGNGQIDVWNLSSTGSLVSTLLDGPYDGWTPIYAASGATQGTTKILWSRWDGELALWSLSANGEYVSDVPLTPPTGETPLGLAVGPDGNIRVLFVGTNGLATLWILNPAGSLIGEDLASTTPGQTIEALSVAADNQNRILVSDGNGFAEIHVLTNASSSTVATIRYGTGGWVPTQLVLDNYGNYWTFWSQPGGVAVIQKNDPTGNYLLSKVLNPE